MNRDYFSSLHPTVNMLYFIYVIGYALTFDNPVCLGISFIGAYSYLMCLKGITAIKQNMKYMLPLIILTAVINPAFSHQGITILAYLPSGNPLTLESILYGISAAVTLAAVITWFSCFNQVFTSDKLMYILGRFIPVLSLMLSMILKFIPDCAKRYREVYSARCGAGLVKNKRFGIIGRIKTGIQVMGTVITWALERTVVVSDSMTARGYGRKGRTAYSIYTFRKRDMKYLLFLILTGVYVLIGGVHGAFSFEYYPFVSGMEWSFYEYTVTCVYVILVFAPVLIHCVEDEKWTSIQSKI